MKRFIMTLVALSFILPQVAGVSQYTDQELALRGSKRQPKFVSIRKTELRWVYAGKAEVTAYCNNCSVCGTTYRTADGTYADYRKRIVAADPTVPFGTTFRIDGFDDSYTVKDRGGKIRGNCIDVLMSSHWRAKRFGRQELDVWTLNPVKVEVRLEIPEGAKLSED